MTPAVIADRLEGRADNDEVAAAAYELFGRSVFPFEGVFLDPQVTSRGPLADSLRRPSPPGSLWSWVPSFCAALADLDQPLGAEVEAGLRAVLAAVEPSTEAPLFAEDLPDLDDPGTDLRSLIDTLATPARSGLFLSAGVLERLGRTTGVPRGFGPRARLLRQLLMGASRYGKLPDVLGGITAVVRVHRQRLATWATNESRAQAVAPWRERLTGTLVLVDAMAVELAEAPSEPMQSDPPGV